ELAHLAKAYPTARTRPAKSVHTFRGRFKGATPDDIGGRGFYRRYVTAMGTGFAYVERFRGDPDPGATVARRMASADELTDLLTGWFAAELGRDRRFGALRTFMDTQFRRDLKNVSMLLWAYSIGYRTANPGEELLARIGLLLVERSYVSSGQLPVLLSILDSVMAAKEPPLMPLMSLFRRLVATKMGIGPEEPIPDSLKFLADPAAAEKSLKAYLAGTEQYEKLLRQWRKEKQANPEAAKPEPMQVLGDFGGDALHFYPKVFSSELTLGSMDDALAVKLSVPEPALTNGEWNAKDRQVVWGDRVEPRAKAYHWLPTVCYAAWATPDEAFQTRHFGKVVLAEKDLWRYCMWRK
ncbi:hypothetical protein LCGC14_3068290, partial [marine sediment metagenome]